MVVFVVVRLINVVIFPMVGSMIMTVLVIFSMLMIVLVFLHRLRGFRVAESYKVKQTGAQCAASIDKHAGIARLPGRGVAVGDHFFIRIRVEMPAVGGNPK